MFCGLKSRVFRGRWCCRSEYQVNNIPSGRADLPGSFFVVPMALMTVFVVGGRARGPTPDWSGRGAGRAGRQRPGRARPPGSPGGGRGASRGGAGRGPGRGDGRGRGRLTSRRLKGRAGRICHSIPEN